MRTYVVIDASKTIEHEKEVRPLMVDDACVLFT
jgi:hypothetical protein